jgi:ribA/ribD-fused uncharacterized protein
MFGIQSWTVTFRHLSCLRWLLITAGDVELNPGPAAGIVRGHESTGASPPAKRLNIRYGCLCGVDNQLESDLYCPECNHAFHELCLAKLLSASEMLQLNPDSYVCHYCTMLEKERFREDSLNGMNMQMEQYLREIKGLREKLCTIQRRYDVMLLQSKNSTQSKTKPTAAPPVSQPKPRIVKGGSDPMSNFFPFTFVFRDVIFDCAEKAYQYFKAMRVKDIQLCRQIQLAPHPAAAKRLARNIPKDTEADFDLMSEILEAKAKQCRSFRDDLRASAGSPILHSTYATDDNFWTTTLNFWDIEAHYLAFRGFNVFGKMLEHIRNNLSEESSYETRTDVEEHGGCAYIKYDGEHVIRPPFPKKPPPRGPSRGRTCHYCWKPNHIARHCYTKRNDEAVIGNRDIDDVKDPIIRSRMRNWQQWNRQESGQAPRIFHNRSQGRERPPSQVVSRDVTEGSSSESSGAQASNLVDMLLFSSNMECDRDSDMSDASNVTVIEASSRCK